MAYLFVVLDTDIEVTNIFASPRLKPHSTRACTYNQAPPHQLGFLEHQVITMISITRI